MSSFVYIESDPNDSNYACRVSEIDEISIEEIKNCGQFGVAVYNCCDMGDAILDKNSNLIISCGGMSNYSGECEKYSSQNNRTVTKCRKI